MIERILLPTDGSPLSERAIPLAETLARAQQAEVILARALRPPPWVREDPSDYLSPEMYQELVNAMEQEALDDLERTAGRLRGTGVRACTALLRGSAAASLLDLEKDVRADLVVMSTHGRTGLASFALGSVADRMVREGIAPVLLMRAFRPALSRVETALEPLDGSPLAEEALALVHALARKPLRQVWLLRAIASPNEEREAREYLARVAERVSDPAFDVAITVDLDSPAQAIERAAQTVDLVIMTTHGRGGLTACGTGVWRSWRRATWRPRCYWCALVSPEHRRRQGPPRPALRSEGDRVFPVVIQVMRAVSCSADAGSSVWNAER